MKNSFTNKIGEKYITNEGYEVEIVDFYNNKYNIKFTYNSHIRCGVAIGELKSGEIKNPFHPSIHGVGYLGVKTNSSISKSLSCIKWKSMIKRCYSKLELKKNPTYKDVTVCEEWHNFQNFSTWFEKKWKPWMDSSWQLDKDILCTDCKIYSPDTCTFVPQEINKLILDTKSYRGLYPQGVWKHGDRFCTDIRRRGVKQHLGTFDTPEEAFEVYRVEKEKWIISVANEWKSLIEPKVYDTLINYKLKITY